jgi:hypothetical protein
MGREVINGVMVIGIRGVFGWIREREKGLFIIVLEDDMRGIGKMIKNMEKVCFSIMKEQLKYLIIDHF